MKAEDYSSPAWGSPCDGGAVGQLLGVLPQLREGVVGATCQGKRDTCLAQCLCKMGRGWALVGRPYAHAVKINKSYMVKFDPQKHHRRSICLKGFDYSSAGAYYVTIVAWQRECLFGDVVNKEMQLNKVGKIVEWEWLGLPKRLSYVSLGVLMFMPNHFHGILFIHENAGATCQGQTSTLSHMD